MQEIEIDRKFEVIGTGKLAQSEIPGSEWMPSANTTFHCSHCEEENPIEIKYRETGKGLFVLYGKYDYFSRTDLLDHDMAREPGKGEQQNILYVGRLPGIYAATQCSHCDTPHIFTFSMGEVQNGRDLCYIKGVWGIEFV